MSRSSLLFSAALMMFSACSVIATPDDEPGCDPMFEGSCGPGSRCVPETRRCMPLQCSAEVCDGQDNDCDGTVDEGAPPDPSRTEFCGQDNDCDGNIGEGASATAESCDGLDNDCDQRIDEQTSDIPELCNGDDDDCDGTVDEGHDADNDSFTTCGTACPGGSNMGPPGMAPDCTLNPDLRDCNDGNGFVNPDARERCDSVDHNCDGLVVPMAQADRNALCAGEASGPVCDQFRGCVPDDCAAPGTTSPCGPEEVCNITTSPASCIRVRCSQEECEEASGGERYCSPITGECEQKLNLLAECNFNDQCRSGVCAPGTALGLSTSVKYCTEACCTDDDCGADQFCWDAGNGARSCVWDDRFTSLTGRTTLGDGGPTSSCSTGSDCRSGECHDGRCAAACRHSSECPSGSVCAAVDLGGRTATVCTSGRGDLDDSCDSDDYCAVNIANACETRCRILGLFDCSDHCSTAVCGTSNQCSGGDTCAFRTVDGANVPMCTTSGGAQVCCNSSQCDANERCTPTAAGDSSLWQMTCQPR